ncbi:MAG: NAD-dependent protein deacetylase [Longimicrobiales bacterium]|nr:NAD-dependent protein deacetylase [Longimicrobiales bacterium]
MISPTRPTDPARLRELVHVLRGRRVVVVAGAGCSTESGIPDYRGPEGSLQRRSPIRYGEFVRRPGARTRYWARSAVGWPRMSATLPNAAHRALAELEAGGVVQGVITQNVDGLHHAAGSRRVVELHGTLSQVVCLECGGRVVRDAFQERLLDRNPGWLDGLADARRRAETAPDGDAELDGVAVEGFRVPGCDRCGGIMKPDVVLFGETVPADRVETAWRLFDEGDAVLVVGSSLAVYSGRRFIYRARDGDVPIAVVNLGPTRADDVAAAKVEDRVGRALPRIARALLPRA